MKEQARGIPEFFKSSVIYQLNFRTFTPEGTINSAIPLLPHLADLGIDMIYLCPVEKMDEDMDQAHWSNRQKASGLLNPKNQYRISEFGVIDEEFGSEDDFKAFVNIAHQLGMAVMLDQVFYHCGPTAPMIETNPDFVLRNEDGSVAYGKWHFPVLNFENPDLREYLIDKLLYWVEEFGVDGFRMDSSAEITMDFWEEARESLDQVNPNLIWLSESSKADDQLNVFDVQYNFDWSMFTKMILLKNKPASAIVELWNQQREKYPEGARFIRYFENHDTVSDAKDHRPEVVFPQEGTDAALALDFLIDGIPFLYNGQEIADGTPHCMFGNRFFSHNNCISWGKALTAAGQSRLNWLKKLIEMRQEMDVLTEGSVCWIENDCPNQLLTFLRTPFEQEDEEECGCGCHCHDDDCCDHDDDCCDHDDDCCDHDDCGDHEHSHQNTQLIVAINMSDAPLAARLDMEIERGTLIQAKIAKDGNYQVQADHSLRVNLLPYGVLVLEI